LRALAEAFRELAPWRATEIEVCLKERATTLGVKTGELIHPARVAASGRSVGAGLYEMFELLGHNKTIERLLAGAEKADRLQTSSV
jgi:glutamyl-tRNA synthetase